MSQLVLKSCFTPHQTSEMENMGHQKWRDEVLQGRICDKIMVTDFFFSASYIPFQPSVTCDH